MQRILAVLLSLAVSPVALALPAAAEGDEAGQEQAQKGEAPPSLAWDQARATELAGQLAQAVKGLRDSARKQPPDTIGSGQSRARMRLLDRLRVIERESRGLSEELHQGEGRASTYPIFRRIDTARRAAAEDARRMFFPAETLDKIKAARGLLEQLRPYYGGPSDTRSDLHGPSRSE